MVGSRSEARLRTLASSSGQGARPIRAPMTGRSRQWTARAGGVRRLLGVVTAGCVAAVACTVAPGMAVAAPAGQECAEPGQTIRPVPWSQEMLAPERVWPFTRGSGVTVAVLDSGVDANHPQLRNRVEAGFDAVRGGGPANTDCLGTGTQVAAVIAARQASSIGFVGMAPNATILPIRVISEGDRQRGEADPAVLARGIEEAAKRKADIIVVSAITYTDTPALRDIVTEVQRKGIIVVAAAGDRGDDGNPTPYPAGYGSVIGVGAVDQSGRPWAKSQQGSYVDLLAPGVEVVTLQRGGGLAVVTGTHVAAGFVGGTAALVTAERKAETTGSQRRRLLLATAVSTVRDRQHGYGIVNPYAAVLDQLVTESPEPLPALARPAARSSPEWDRARNLATIGTLVAVLAVIAVLVVAVAVPRGRQRFWRPALAPAPPPLMESDEPSPPALLFDEPAR